MVTLRWHQPCTGQSDDPLAEHAGDRAFELLMPVQALSLAVPGAEGPRGHIGSGLVSGKFLAEMGGEDLAEDLVGNGVALPFNDMSPGVGGAGSQGSCYLDGPWVLVAGDG